jgi:hypothetical protein
MDFIKFMVYYPPSVMYNPLELINKEFEILNRELLNNLVNKG